MGLRKLLKRYLYRRKFSISDSKNSINNIKNQNIIITGANSGIGLALTKKLLELNNVIIATFNKTNDNLLKLKSDNLKIYQCDQSQLDNIDKLTDCVKNIPINIIINNAGVWGGENQNFNKIDYENFLKASNINAISILKLSELVLKHSTSRTLKSILNISSLYSSTEQNISGRDYVYKGTKSMMNSFSKNLSIDLNRDYGVSVFSICPGSVKTKLNPGGILEPKIAALNIINILEDANKLNGKFIDLNKNELGW